MENDTAAKTQDGAVAKGVFLAIVTGASLVFGFGTTLARARRKDPDSFDAGGAARMEEGVALARRALLRGTLIAVAGTTTLAVLGCCLLGITHIEELPRKMKSAMPRVPRPESKGRTEFASVRELFSYLIDESGPSDGDK